MTTPRTGGTITHPAQLYPPGAGGCHICGRRDVPTHGGDRLDSHGAWNGGRATDPAQPYTIRTCPGTGHRAIMTPCPGTTHAPAATATDATTAPNANAT